MKQVGKEEEKYTELKQKKPEIRWRGGVTWVGF
jgi:hypothetical protein